ncbi:MAG: hypothetical protein WA705_09515 [Candidatus Ozemobacteraceae bacterium]
MSDSKIRMARLDEQEIQGHTIVGGRPAGKTGIGGNIPRGLEILLKKASIDPEFMTSLLDHRAVAADEIHIPLDPSERAMLETLPREQLSAIIIKTHVPAAQRSIFQGGSVPVMVALLSQLWATGGNAQIPPCPGGCLADKPVIQDEQPQHPEAYFGGIRPDNPSSDPVDAPVLPEPDIRAEEKAKKQNISIDVSGKLFLEAIQDIQKEVGTKIIVEGCNGLNVSQPIMVSTDDLSLHEALRTIAQNVGKTSFDFRIVYEDDIIRIVFNQVSSGLSNPPSSEAPPRPSPNMVPGEAQSKGHRPDFPSGVTRGIRPDYPGKN